MALSGGIKDIQAGTVRLTTDQGVLKEYDIDSLEMDWKITPLANSIKGLIRDIPADIDDRGALMTTLGYLEQPDSEQAIREAVQKFINDQTVLIDIRN